MRKSTHVSKMLPTSQSQTKHSQVRQKVLRRNEEGSSRRGVLCTTTALMGFLRSTRDSDSSWSFQRIGSIGRFDFGTSTSSKAETSLNWDPRPCRLELLLGSCVPVFSRRAPCIWFRDTAGCYGRISMSSTTTTTKMRSKCQFKLHLRIKIHEEPHKKHLIHHCLLKRLRNLTK